MILKNLYTVSDKELTTNELPSWENKAVKAVSIKEAKAKEAEYFLAELEEIEDALEFIEFPHIGSKTLRGA